MICKRVLTPNAETPYDPPVPNTEDLQTAWITDPDAIADLRAWDWRAELRAQERTMTWLARNTDRSLSALYRYLYGSLTPPETWLRDVARLLGKRVAA